MFFLQPSFEDYYGGWRWRARTGCTYFRSVYGSVVLLLGWKNWAASVNVIDVKEEHSSLFICTKRVTSCRISSPFLSALYYMHSFIYTIFKSNGSPLKSNWALPSMLGALKSNYNTCPRKCIEFFTLKLKLHRKLEQFPFQRTSSI